MEKRELVIIGAGPAGLSAAIYGKRAGLDTLVLEKGRPGGQVLITSKIENYPGILDGTGSGLADAFRTHAEHFKAEFRTASVQKLEVRDGEKIITLKDGSEIAAGAVIVASGASFRKQGCPGESTYTGMGVSYCAVCDAAFFEELEVAVIGGGMVGCETAEYLAARGCKVSVIEMMDKIAAGESTTILPTLLENYKTYGVEQYPSHKVKEFRMDAVVCENKDGAEVTIPCDYIVLAMGARSNEFDAAALEAASIPVHSIGDAAGKAADISNAIRTGYDTACQL